MKKIGSVLVLMVLSSGASADWVRVAENNRLVAYADTGAKRTGNTVTGWVLFDYKTTQQSSLSGKRYLSEKDQTEFNCQSEQQRITFFTWHADRMGDGTVVYTGRKPTEWEPTSAPTSVGNALAKFFCAR